jgi:D-3-phosphoglycerate dehydrogenase
MFRIQTYNKISDKGLSRFPAQQFEVSDELPMPDAYLLRSQILQAEQTPASILAVARAGAGVNNIPVEQYSSRGIVVFNTPGANANAVKELVVAGLLMSSRGIADGIEFVRSLDDTSDSATLHKRLEAEKKRFAGCELSGKTLGVVGLGAIGSMVADVALALGMKVLGYDPALSIEAAWRLSSSVHKMEDLQSLVAQSDYVSLHIPAIEATRHMINAEVIASARRGTILLNFARATVVNPDAIGAAIDSGQLAKYVCDFPEPQLLDKPNVIAMPHVGASTAEAEENCAVMAADQLMDYLLNGNIINSVNFPRVTMARVPGARITFSNDNVAGVLGDVLSILADSQVNVVDMVNRSRGDLAYSIIDVEDSPNSDVIDKIASAEHVIAARIVP